MEYTQLIIIAILVEAIWENLKMIWDGKKFSINKIGSLVLAIVICALTGVDIFPVIGLPITIPFVGSCLTGIVVSRGANFVNDLFTKLTEVKKGGK